LNIDILFNLLPVSIWIFQKNSVREKKLHFLILDLLKRKYFLVITDKHYFTKFLIFRIHTHHMRSFNMQFCLNTTENWSFFWYLFSSLQSSLVFLYAYSLYGSIFFGPYPLHIMRDNCIRLEQACQTGGPIACLMRPDVSYLNQTITWN